MSQVSVQVDDYVKAEAEKNKRLSESLTGNVVDYYWMKRWDGKLPTTVLGSDSNYMVDLHGKSEVKKEVF